MPIAMVMMLSLEIFPVFPVWHVSPTFPIWFSLLHMAVLCGGRSLFPLDLLPHFPLSPFPFPLSPFPFPFPKGHKQIVGSKDENHNQIEVVTYTAVNNRCAIVFQTGGFVFSVAPFFLGGGGGGAGKHQIVGGGWVGHRGGFPVKDLVWTTAGGGG